MKESDICIIARAFKEQGWDKPESQYKLYYEQHIEETRRVVIAEYDGEFAGYITIVFHSLDSYFSERGIPEIVDFNVLIKFRKCGIGSRLMDEAEEFCFKQYETIGLSVGLLSDYGSAIRMYVKRGYVPVGDGIKYRNKVLSYFEQVQVDDDLVLSFTKNRKTANFEKFLQKKHHNKLILVKSVSETPINNKANVLNSFL